MGIKKTPRILPHQDHAPLFLNSLIFHCAEISLSLSLSLIIQNDSGYTCNMSISFTTF